MVHHPSGARNEAGSFSILHLILSFGIVDFLVRVSSCDFVDRLISRPSERSTK